MNLVKADLINGNRDLVEVTLDRIRAFAPKDRPYKVAYSGGKDSCVMLKLFQMSGVDYEAFYSPTSVDPPELIRFIRKEHPEVKILPYKKDDDGNLITMWYLIEKKLMPPTGKVRYCCDYLKEDVGGVGDTVALGVRAEESRDRSKLPMIGFWKAKIVFRPLIDWDLDDIWLFIRRYNIAYCELYDQGFKRIGCIGCPKNPKAQKRELELYPNYKKLYIRAFDKMIKERIRRGKKCNWKNGQEVLDWWINWNLKHKDVEGQCSLM